MNKSDQIRSLYDQGFKVQQIADRLGIRYQFAYNVIRHYAQQKELQTVTAQAAPTQEFSFWRWIAGRA